MLEDILITEELSRRAAMRLEGSSRSPNWQAEAQALQALTRQLARGSETLLQSLVETAVELCQAGTAGVSLPETTPDGTEVWRWAALAGTLASSVGTTTAGTTTPRDSPCGICLEHGTPQLFSYPDRYFTYLQAANRPIVEALVLPLIADGQAIGTIWIMSHDEQRQFDPEDLRVMTSLADFAAAALLLNQSKKQEILTNTRLETLQERNRVVQEAAELATWDWHITTNRVIWNEQHYRLLGLEPRQGEENPDSFIQTIHPEDLPVVREKLERSLSTCGVYQADFRIVRADTQEIRWMSGYGRVIAAQAGRATRMAGVMTDTTERQTALHHRKRQEVNLAFLAQTSADFAPLLSVEEIMERVGERLANFLNLSRCNFSVVDEAADHIECIYAWRRNDSMPNLFGPHRISTFLSEAGRRHYAAGKLSVINDTRTNEMLNPTAELWNELGFGSIVDAPYLKDGRWQFLLTIARSQASEWREDEVELIRELAERIYIRIERARAEEALRVSEERFRLFVNASSDTLYRMSADWSQMISLKGMQFLANTEHPTGTWIEQYIPEEDQPSVQAAIRNAIETKGTFELEHRVTRSDGAIGWALSRAMPVLDPQGEIVEWFGAASDITARRQAEEAMRAFFSNVSHEFRTPLTLLLSSIQETLNDPAHSRNSAQRSQLELAHQNAIRLLKLVNTLLDVSRIEAGRIQAVYEPIDLATLTTELASSFESAITQAGLQLVIDCPPLSQPVYVDRSLWEKIVLNLLSNALKFTFTGKITVRLTSTRDRVELTVQDTGIGIAAAELPLLFERFHQVKGAKGRSFEGSGIGLSLVQELVKLHGGTIAVNSIEGEGSCFTVSIPTGFAHLPAGQIGASQTLSATAAGSGAYVEEALGWLPKENLGLGRTDTGSRNSHSGEQTNHLKSKIQDPKSRILLVDDNAHMQAYLKRLLEERWQVETAANGAIALTKIQQNPPDLVLTDVMMPEMDGLQLLQALRSDPQTQSIPIILLSARAGEEATIEGLETGADDYLIKPFSARELIARVEAHLQLALLRQERSANQFKTEFLLTITHELQAPLALILGWVRLLQTKSFNAGTMAQALDTIERNAAIEAKLIKDLLDVSGLLSGKVQLKSQVVELDPLLKSVTAQFRTAAAAKQIQLTETILNVPQRNVVADGDRLKQILANLLDNAIKFTPEGGQVTVRLECAGSEVQITVADTGIGILPEFLPYVFDRFTQAEVPSRYSPGGVGIGLAIARLLVELHRGTIEVVSEGEGRGATFTVRLPLRMDNS